MGLDQYIFSVRKIKDSNILNEFKNPISDERMYDLESITDNVSIRFFYKDDDDTDSFKCLLPYMTSVLVNNEYIDTKQLIRDKYGQDSDLEDVYETSWSYTEDKEIWKFSKYADQGNEVLNYEIIYTDEDYKQKKHTYIQQDEMLAFEREELCYWRKDYLLQTYMRRVREYDGNCVFKSFSKDEWLEILDDFKSLQKENINDVIRRFDIDLDQWQDTGYWENSIQYTIENLEKIMLEENFENSMVCYYEWY